MGPGEEPNSSSCQSAWRAWENRNLARVENPETGDIELLNLLDSDGDDPFDLFKADGSLNDDDYLEFEDINFDGPLTFSDRATSNSAAARLMARENTIEGHQRLGSGEGSSNQNDHVHSNVFSRPSRLRSRTMRSQPRETSHHGQPQSSSSEVDIDCLGISQSSPSQTDSESPEPGSRKRRRALSPSHPPQSLSNRLIRQHHSTSYAFNPTVSAASLRRDSHAADSSSVHNFYPTLFSVTSNAGHDSGQSTSQVPSTPTPQAHKRQRSIWRIPPHLEGSASLFLISEIYPRSFDNEKKAMLDSIFQDPSNCVPLAVTMSRDSNSAADHRLANIPRSTRRAMHLPLGPGGRGWPPDRIPLEVFHNIVDNLPRASVQAMRHVNAEFEMKTSNRLFHTVVVPFRSEIYGMMTHMRDITGLKRKDAKGKGKAQAVADEEPEDDRSVHDGMKVFEAWGPHIKKFAMAFEVDEVDLEQAPIKSRYESHGTWWGSYKWPHPYYFRYEFCQGLEKKADEFKCMSEALSHLKGTQELGLSLNSGLGWLSGPDMSDRARMFREKTEIFGRNHLRPSVEMQERENVWTGIADSFSHGKAEWKTRLHGNVILESNPEDSLDAPGNDWHYPTIFEGIDLATKGPNMTPDDHVQYASEGLKGLTKSAAGRFANAPLKPSELSVPQQEWLLETEWAQRAFLSSFCMALADNSQTFQHVHSLNISKLSSRYLIALEREDFWKALPNLTSLTILVSPDWRTVSKLDTGLVEAPAIDPSKAVTYFHRLLQNHVAHVESIKTLKIGYVGGGEHQTGIFGRNKSILPAPLLDTSDAKAVLADVRVPDPVLKLPSIKSITFDNCWMTPAMLQEFALCAGRANLQELHLHSVSLTAQPGSVGVERLEFSPEDGVHYSPQEPTRIGCPSVGNFFDFSCLPPLYHKQGWLTTPLRIGSWANVLDTITPGPTRDFIRYVYGHREQPPALRTTSLQRVTLESCGYVKLPQFSAFVGQEILGEIEPLAGCLIKRAAELQTVMMTQPNDMLLGQIVPRIWPLEHETLESAYGMRFGWEDDDDDGRRLHNREDGQVDGGKGRFSGVLRKLVLPPVDIV